MAAASTPLPGRSARARSSASFTALPATPAWRRLADCVPIDASNIVEVADFAQTIKADLTVVGPELPMVLGIGDEFVRRELPIFCPSRGAAEIEGSKAFAREFMSRHSIPSPAYEVCGSLEDALAFVKKAPWGYPFVVKADGLAAGKGSVIVEDAAEARTAVEEMMSEKRFGSAGAKVVMEEFLQGEEVSFLVISDGARVVPLASVQDHKRALDGDKGPNTGGMGTVSPTTNLRLDAHKRIMQEIIVPTIAGMACGGPALPGSALRRPDDDRVGAEGARVQRPLRRPRDPGDHGADALGHRAAAPAGRGRTARSRRASSGRRSRSVCVVLASRGYPDCPGDGPGGARASSRSRTGATSSSTTPPRTATATRSRPSAGGCLGVTALGANLESAIARAYEAVGHISFEGMHYRKDIGHRALARLQSRG